MISFSVEPLSVAWDDIVRLADRGWNEVEAQRHPDPHCMKRERYQEFEDAGMLYCALARDDGRAVGYTIGIIYDSLHTQARMCVDDGIYLDPAYRGRNVALRFMRFVEDRAMELGVKEMLFLANTGGKIERILDFLDYEPIAVQYFKRLGRADSAYPSIAVMEKSSNELRRQFKTPQTP